MLVAAGWRHVGYIMLLYLAGLKGVDPSLREAAAVDGAIGDQTFFRVVFPVMRPINIIVLVVTVIESLRAFDLVWVINKGRNGLELISALVTQNIVGEASRIGFGSALATIMLVVSLVFITIYLRDRDAGGASDERRDRHRPAEAGRAPARRRSRAAGAGRCCTCFLVVGRTGLAVPDPLGGAHLVPLLRRTPPRNGYVSLGGWTFDNYVNAWRTAEFGKHFLNSVYITVPAVLLTLFLASCVAFVIARFSWKLNIALLGLFTAANLLPQQALLIPLFRMFTEIPLPALMSDSELLLRQLLGPDPGQRRLPDRLLRRSCSATT